MKKVIFAISVIAATVFGVSSCQREQAVQDEMPSGKKVTISFIAEKAGVDTKTAAVEEKDGVSYKWTEEDKDNIKLFTVKGDGSLDTEITDIMPSFSEDYRILTISAEVEANQSYTFRAMLSGDWTNSGDKPRIKPTQIPNGTENFDPTADVLVSDDFEVSVGEEAEAPMLLTFRRQVVVNKMTLKKLTSEEKVKKVTIKSDKHLTGYLEKGKMSGQQKELSLSYNDEVVPKSGEFDVYFVTMENTGQKLTVEVTTDQYSYAKTFVDKTIDFNLGQFTKFGVVLPNGEPVVDFVAGDYFITSTYNSIVYAAKAYNTGNNNLSNPLTINVNVDEGSIEYKNDIEDCVFSIRPVSGVEDHEGEFTIQDANGLYLYAAGGASNNYLKGETAPDTNGNAYWKIEKNPDGTYSVTSQGSATRNTLQFTFNNNNPIFSCYATNQTAITLYPAEWCKIDKTPVVTIAEEERTKTVTSAATSVNFAYNANRYATEPLTVTVSSDVNKIIADDAPVVEMGIITVSLNPNTENIVKTASLTVNGDGLEDAPVTLTITQEAYAEWKAGYETFDLTTASYSSASASSVTWTGSSTIITNEKGSSSINANNYLGGSTSGNTTRTSTRFYNGHNLSIVPQNGYIITSVVFTATDNYASTLVNSTWTNATASSIDKIVTVTPADGASPITAAVGGTCGFTSIVVNYLTLGSGEEGGNGGGTTDPDPDPDPDIDHDLQTVTCVMSDYFTSDTNLISTQTYKFDGFSFTFTKKNNNSTSNYNASEKGIRFYASDIWDIDAGTKKIVKIVFTPLKPSSNTGPFTSDSGTYDKDAYTWTSASTEGVSTLRLTASAQFRYTAFTITYFE